MLTDTKLQCFPYLVIGFANVHLGFEQISL